MAYSGTTAASSLANPPRCIAGPALYGNQGTSGLTTAPGSGNTQGGNLWSYCSTNKTTDLIVAGFFSDGYALGMRPGDIVMAIQFTSAGSSVLLSVHPVTVVNSTSGVATVSAGTAGYLSTTRGTSI